MCKLDDLVPKFCNLGWGNYCEIDREAQKRGLALFWTDYVDICPVVVCISFVLCKITSHMLMLNNISYGYVLCCLLIWCMTYTR